jgi:excisionase family DNA binding protein
MRHEHNSGPDNGSHSNIPPQTPRTDLDGHACPVSRNNRGRCRAWECLTGTGDQKQNELNEALRCFAQHHNWHDPGHITNKLKLRLAFAKPIRTTVNEFLADRRDGLAEQIRGDFARLQEAIHAIDRMCGKRCDEEDELGRLEHTKAQLERSILELADLIESGVPHRHGGLNPQERVAVAGLEEKTAKTEWITYQEAAKLLFVDKSTVSRWVQRGILESNGKKGRRRRVSKGSVLIKERQDGAD